MKLTWRPQPFANMNDDEIKVWQPRTDRLEQVESVPRRTQVSSALHLIRGRRIQSRILSILMRADYEPRFGASHQWRLHMLEILNQWKAQLQPHSDPLSRGYTSEGWVGMLYNYTVLLLYRPTQANVCDRVVEGCIQACTDIALTFWTYLKSRQTAQLWPGVSRRLPRPVARSLLTTLQLLSQFGIGITLLYCLWVVAPARRPAPLQSSKVGTAIRTISVILAVLAERWTQAEPLRDVFDLLADAIPVHCSPHDLTERRISRSSADRIQHQLPRLHALVVNKDILRMLTEMATEDYPWDDDRTAHLAAWSSGDVHTAHDCPLCWESRPGLEPFAPVGFGAGDLWPAFDGHAITSFTVSPEGYPLFPGLLGSIEF